MLLDVLECILHANTVVGNIEDYLMGLIANSFFRNFNLLIQGINSIGMVHKNYFQPYC